MKQFRFLSICSFEKIGGVLHILALRLSNIPGVFLYILPSFTPSGVSATLDLATAWGRKDWLSPSGCSWTGGSPTHADGLGVCGCVSTRRLLTGGSTAGRCLVEGLRPFRIKALEEGEPGSSAAAKLSNRLAAMFAPSRTKTRQTRTSMTSLFLWYAHPYKVFSITHITQIKMSKRRLRGSECAWVPPPPSLFKGCESSHHSDEPFNALNTHQEALSRCATSNNSAHIAALWCGEVCLSPSFDVKLVALRLRHPLNA